MEQDRPTLNYLDPVDGTQVQIAFGYFANQPHAAIIRGETLLLIPRDVLLIAGHQGWGSDEDALGWEGADVEA